MMGSRIENLPRVESSVEWRAALAGDKESVMTALYDAVLQSIERLKERRELSDAEEDTLMTEGIDIVTQYLPEGPEGVNRYSHVHFINHLRRTLGNHLSRIRSHVPLVSLEEALQNGENSVFAESIRPMQKEVRSELRRDVQSIISYLDKRSEAVFKSEESEILQEYFAENESSIKSLQKEIDLARIAGFKEDEFMEHKIRISKLVREQIGIEREIKRLKESKVKQEEENKKESTAREIFYGRLGLNQERKRKTLRKMADEIKISPERVRQIYFRYIEDLREDPFIQETMGGYIDSISEDTPAPGDVSDFLAGAEAHLLAERKKARAHRETASVKVQHARQTLAQKVGSEKAESLYELFAGDPTGFIGFIKEKYGLTPTQREMRKVMNLSAADKQHVRSGVSTKESGLELRIDDQYVESLLAQLDVNERQGYQTAIMPRLIDRLMPLFVRDPTKTMALIAQLKDKQPLFANVYDYLREVKNVDLPGLKTELKPYQKADVLFMERNPHTLLANDMGLGKSLTILAALRKSSAEKVLITCPASATHGVWASEIAKHFDTPSRFHVMRGRDVAELPAIHAANDIIIAGYSVMSRYPEAFKELPFDAIVVDESHMTVNEDTQRYRALAQIHAARKIQSSGTPFKNTRGELWAPLRWLAPERFDMSWEDYGRKYMSDEGLFALAYDLRNVMIRRRKSEMLPDLPILTEIDVPVKLTSSEKNNYELVERDFVTWLRKNAGTSASTIRMAKGLIMSKMHALRQATLEAKVREAREIVEEIHGRGEKVLIATTYLNPARIIYDQLGVERTSYIDGTIAARLREKEIYEFQTNPQKNTMIITEAGSQSITLTGANNVIIINEPWTAAARQQTIDRVHRLGQERPVNVYTLLARGTVDYRIHDLIASKASEISQVLDSPTSYLAYTRDEIKEIAHLLEKITD